MSLPTKPCCQTRLVMVKKRLGATTTMVKQRENATLKRLPKDGAVNGIGF